MLDMTERKVVESLHDIQRISLEKVIDGEPISNILNTLCLQVELTVSPSVCSIMLFDEQTGCLTVAAWNCAEKCCKTMRLPGYCF